jgi:hypothetical protein
MPRPARLIKDVYVPEYDRLFKAGTEVTHLMEMEDRHSVKCESEGREYWFHVAKDKVEIIQTQQQG